MLVAFVEVMLFSSSPGSQLELLFLDGYLRRAPLPAPKDIVIVRIDQDSYTNLGHSTLEVCHAPAMRTS